MIHEPGCAAAIWLRKPLHSFQSWIDTLPKEQLPQARVILRPRNVHGALENLCDLFGTPKGPNRDLLTGDIAALSDLFAGVMDAPYLRLRLVLAPSDAQSTFHQHSLKARLICTYRGRGTQFGNAPDPDVPETIFSVKTGSPIILRGKLWPEMPNADLLHRSPPTSTSDAMRLRLTLDPVFEQDHQVEMDNFILH